MKKKLVYIIGSISFLYLCFTIIFLVKELKLTLPTVKKIALTEITKTVNSFSVSSVKPAFCTNKNLNQLILGLNSASLEAINQQLLQTTVRQTGVLIADLATQVGNIITKLHSSVAVKKGFHTFKTNHTTLKQVSFTQLPGWNETNIKKSLQVFQKSCKTFLKQKPNHAVGSRHIKLQAKDWHPVCKEALLIKPEYEFAARMFFEKWFYPIELAKNKPVHGLFTGYYMPLIKGNLTQTRHYTIPIYGVPWDLKKETLSGRRRGYYTRAEIDQGRLNKKAPVLAWINSPAERLFLETEGGGVIKLASGKKLHLGYAGENGAPYTSITSVLIKKGVMTRDNASKNAIKRYLKQGSQKNLTTLLHTNKSFVFFKNLKKTKSLGAQGMALTPGYSLAIDRKWIPLGTPLWLSTKVPDNIAENEKKFQRLMVAQDTGGAIKGVMRGDIYWGSGKKAMYLGQHMKNQGRYWLLLPKQAFDKLSSLKKFLH